MSEHILRIPRSDSEGDYVLIQVKSRSSSALDLKFVATEGEAPYVGSLKSSQISKLRAKNYKGSDEEWTDILSHIFAQRDSSTSESNDWKSGLEVVAAVKSDDEDEGQIVITLRKRIDSITQRLGAVTLQQNDDQAIELFEWAGTAVNRGNKLASEILTLETRYREAEETITKLNSQLEDLITAKNEHDDQLIAKFAKLLNEKKLKIRNQQRLLATANVNEAKLAQVEAANVGKKPRKASASRKSKRKAEESLPTDSESEDAFDTMDIDRPTDNKEKHNEEDPDLEATASEDDRQSTPEPLEDETASEDEEPSAPPPQSTKKSEASQSSSQREGSSRSSRTAAAEPSSPPPRRELPFARRKANPAPAASPAVKEDASDTTSDDEL